MLGTLSFLFAAPRQQHVPADTRLHCQFNKTTDGLDRTRHGKIRLVGDIDGANPPQRLCPGLSIIPIETWDCRS